MSLFPSGAGSLLDTGRSWGGRAYPDPFMSYATLAMPRTVEELLKWCETLASRNGTYSMASRRVVRYFLTKIEIQKASDEERVKYLKFLDETLNVMTTMASMGDDLLTYGNSFSSLFVPFRRYLTCPKCPAVVPITEIVYKWSSFQFNWTCQHCNRNVTTDKPTDRRTMEEARAAVIRWSPHHIRIRHHPISQRRIYLWDPPAELTRSITEGDPFIMEEMPWEMIQAIKARKMFRFAPRVIYHMREEGLAGIKSGGWGVSRFLSNFSQAFHVQMLKMYNEVICQEYIVPFRLLSPAAAGANDPMVTSNLGSMNAKVGAMLDNHRRRPGGWNFVPFPMTYQVLGGEGNSLAPQELLNAAMDELLNSAGFPAEMYKGTLQFQAMPTALRLFQQTWPHLVASFNGWLRWLTDTSAQVFNWEPVTAALQPVTLADDIENKQLLLSLAAANQLPKSVAYAPLGIDAREAMTKIFDEQREYVEAQAKFDREMQHRQQVDQQLNSSTMAAAGVPGQPASGEAAMTPTDQVAQAEQIAAQLVAMPETQRKQELAKIRKSDETLWALVKAKMQLQRTQAESQGRQALQAPPGSAQPPPQ